MLKVENTETYGWEEAVRGMRNPMNSWAKIDSYYGCEEGSCDWCKEFAPDEPCPNRSGNSIKRYILGDNDLNLMERLRNAGTDHRKYLRMIIVSCDIIAPLYWWKEFDTYKVGTVANSCSTMHKIQAKEFTKEDFSLEHLMRWNVMGGSDKDAPLIFVNDAEYPTDPIGLLRATILMLNECRKRYLKTKDKRFWWQMIQLLPSSYNQKRTVMLNYEVLVNIYKSRKDHKLDEWHTFCDWIETLPYSRLIVGDNK